MDDYPSPATTDALRHRGKGGRGQASPAPKCKTCVSCRLRKGKCDGARPRCGYCAIVNRDCYYPQDARRINRPSRSHIRTLEASIESLWKIIEENDIPVGGRTRRTLSSTIREESDARLVDPSGINPPNDLASPMRRLVEHPAPGNGDVRDQLWSNGQGYSPPPHGRRSRGSPIAQFSDAAESAETNDASPSPSEVRIAGAVTSDGDIEVHGVASMFHRQSPGSNEMTSPRFTSGTEREKQNQISQARLVAYASEQKQRELILLRNPSMNQNLDFDGVDPELALHMIDTHFNRQHYTFMISYRPAIMDSLANGGRYCNKILLNAIYLSSSVYSDRVELRSNPSDPYSAGEQFYRRLRSLFPEHIDTPSIPTAVGLLLSGAILVSTGKISAGWVHSGIAYRMIIDLGCHLTIESRRANLTGETALLTDIELEIRKRLYWGAFLTDATQSLYFGRPPSLRPSQARVSQLLLDTYEELEAWHRYVDPRSPSPARPLGPYVPRPAYAVSTFNAMVRLMEISSRIIRAFYSMQSLQRSRGHIRELKGAMDVELERWFTSLPSHLKFNPDKDPTFPPHQLTLLTTYHTLQILLRRPCIATGHLSKHFDGDEQAAGEHISVQAALDIYRLVGSYKTTFGLHRAPYLVSYSVYSAIVAILNQKHLPRSHFTDCMSFFWAALADLQRACNFGLQKPMDILRDMMDQFGEEMPRRLEDQSGENIAGTSDRAGNLFDGIYRAVDEVSAVAGEPQSSLWNPTQLNSSDSAFEEMDWPVNDALYGLFTPDI